MASSKVRREAAPTVSAETGLDAGASIEGTAAVGGLAQATTAQRQRLVVEPSPVRMATLISDERVTVTVDGRELLGPLVSDKRSTVIVEL